MTKLLRTLPVCFCLIVILLDVAIAKGGFRGGGGSRGSYSSRPSYSSRTPTRTSSSSGSSSGNSGWQRPNTQTHTSNTGSHTSSGSQTSSSGSHVGWQKPNSSPTHTSSGSNSGWQKQNTPSQTSGTGSAQRPNTQTSSGTNYGWQKPGTPNTGSSHSSTNTGTNTQTGTNYGWQKPNTGTSSNTNARQPPPYSAHDPHKPANPPSYTATNVQHSQRPPAYSVNDPNKSPPPAYTRYDSGKHPSQNIGPGGYPVQNNHVYTGPAHTASYSQPHVQPSSYGYSPSYYPSNTQVGYPGGGIYPGSNAYSHQGMGIFGSPNHGYSYPTSNSWGYSNYGSGGYGSSKSSTATNILGGFVAGYATNSLIHSLTRPSNPWGYSGGGYGGGYGYNGGYNPARNTYITNNYNYGNGTNGTANNEPIPNKPEDKWVHCVAYDPVTKETLINPNCSCSVTQTTDPVTNVTTSVHNCKTEDGRDVEMVVTPAPQTITPVKYQQRYATGYITDSAPHNKIDAKEEKRNEIYRELEKYLNVGKLAN